MLQALRKGTASWIAKIFIGLLVLSFAVWGIADIFGGYGRRTVATVGDTEITYEDFQSALNLQVQSLGRQLGRPLTLEEARAFGIDQQVLNSLIQEAALENQGAAMNLGISDKAIAERIVREDFFKDASGRFSKDIFDQLLAANGLSEARYVALQRDTYVRQQLIDTIGNGVYVPKTLLKAVDVYRNQTRRLKYFILPFDKIEPVGEPAPEELKTFYEERKTAYSDPEFRKIGILALRPKEVGQKLTVNEEDLKRFYEVRKGDYHSPEQRLVRQIPFANEAEAQKAYEQIQEGATFDKIAAERNLSEEDTTLGLVTQSEMADDVIAEAAFALEENQVSAPVKGRLSTVLLLVTEIKSEQTTPFDSVKEEIRTKVAEQRAIDEIHELHNRIEDERASGASLAEVAKTLNLEYRVIDAVDRSGKAPGGAEVTDLLERDRVLSEAYQTEPGVEIDPIETEEQGLVWLEVLEIIPSKVKPFDEVRDKVATDWKERQERSRLIGLAQELVERARKGETLDAIAGGLGLEVKESEPIKRDASHDTLSRAAISLAFSLSEGGYGAADAKDGNGRVILKVENIERPTALTADAEDALRQSYTTQIAQDLVDQYVTALTETFHVSRNQPLIDELTGRTERQTGLR